MKTFSESKMKTYRSEEEIVAKYGRELRHLLGNSKPVITALTKLADENIRFAPAIVACIEKHLGQVPVNLKLAVLYLIDSIVKNVKRDYVILFSQNIVTSFTKTFQEIYKLGDTNNEAPIRQMCKLRCTWDSIFTGRVLEGIDSVCKLTDPEWAVKVPSTGRNKIHVNPKFLARALQKREGSSSRILKLEYKPSSVSKGTGSGSIQENADLNMQNREEQLLKQKRLLELQAKKMEMELLQYKAKLAEQESDLQSSPLESFESPPSLKEYTVGTSDSLSPSPVLPSSYDQLCLGQPNPMVTTSAFGLSGRGPYVDVDTTAIRDPPVNIDTSTNRSRIGKENSSAHSKLTTSNSDTKLQHEVVSGSSYVPDDIIPDAEEFTSDRDNSNESIPSPGSRVPVQVENLKRKSLTLSRGDSSNFSLTSSSDLSVLAPSSVKKSKTECSFDESPDYSSPALESHGDTDLRQPSSTGWASTGSKASDLKAELDIGKSVHNSSTTPGSAVGGDNDYKPESLIPGGSNVDESFERQLYYSGCPESNIIGSSWNRNQQKFNIQRPQHPGFVNDYKRIKRNPWTGAMGPNLWDSFNPPPAERYGFGDSASYKWNPGPQQGFISQRNGPNPFVEAVSWSRDSFVPPVNEYELEIARHNIPGMVPINGVMKEVRFYGKTAVIFDGVNSSDPREISFRGGASKYLSIDRIREPVRCCVGKSTTIYLNGNKHLLFLGAPTRELYIDGIAYELAFGGKPIVIQVDGVLHTFKLEGPPPQVQVSSVLRHDLVAGRVDIILGGNKFPMYLDEKPQLVDVFNIPLILRFTDAFHTLNINGKAFPVNFGGAPLPITLPDGSQHVLTFAALSENIRKGMSYYVRNRSRRTSTDKTRGRVQQQQGIGASSSNHNTPKTTRPAVPEVVDTVEKYVPELQASQDTSTNGNKNDTGVLQKKTTSPSKEIGDVNMLDLLSKLKVAGLLPSPIKESTLPVCKSPACTKDSPKPDAEEESKPELTVVEKDTKDLDRKKEVVVVESNFQELKQRQPHLIAQLCSGSQCSSCGWRFPQELSEKFTQHLDWHFKKNRKMKEKTKKMFRRQLYYCLSDWMQYSELEDVEDRATSIFEMAVDGDDISVSEGKLVGDDRTTSCVGREGAVCPQCGEGFEVFFDEENEDWKFRRAVVCENPESKQESVYHPLCQKDLLASLEGKSVLMDLSCIEVHDSEKTESPPEQAVDESKILCSSVVDGEKDVEIVLKEQPSVVVMYMVDEYQSKEETIDDNSVNTQALPDQDVTENINGEAVHADGAVLEPPLAMDEFPPKNDKTPPPLPEVESSVDHTDLHNCLEESISGNECEEVESSGNIENAGVPGLIHSEELHVDVVQKFVNEEHQHVVAVTEELPNCAQLDGPVCEKAEKPLFRDRKFTVYPPKQKGQEVSGLCHIS